MLWVEVGASGVSGDIVGEGEAARDKGDGAVKTEGKIMPNYSISNNMIPPLSIYKSGGIW